MLTIMTSSTSNIEAVARDICSQQLSRHGACGAELEVGQIDDDGHPVPDISLDEGLVAYRDWCYRHPESKPALSPV